MKKTSLKQKLVTISMLALVTGSLTQGMPIISAQDSVATYTVKYGEGLYRIAMNHGMTLDELKELNGLTSNMIYPGNVLKVYQKQSNSEETSNPTPTQATPPVTEVVETTQEITDTTEATSTSRVATGQTYTVVPGDYLHKIASKFAITVNQLKEWNGLNSNYIYVGDQLVVKKASSTSPAPTPTPTTEVTTTKPTPSPARGQTYTVVAGDYLHKIATKYGITVSQLKEWNGLTSNYIYPGDRLVVKKSSPTSPAPTPTSTTEVTTTKPTPTTEKATPSKQKTYTVKSGDYLYKIASQFGITVDQLKQWNNLTTNFIYVGNILKVSQPTSTTPTPSPGSDRVEGPKQNPVKDGQTVNYIPMKEYVHVVESGDTLYSIAATYECSVQFLRDRNKLTSDYLTRGQRLIVKDVVQDKVKIETSPNLDEDAQRIIDVARHYLGVKKYSAEHRKLVDAYNRIYPKPVSYTLTYDDDWCDAFVTHIADVAGLSHLTGREVGVERHKNIMKNKGIWLGITKPKAGDLVVFNWDGSRNAWGHHIGIVEAVQNDTISTIEGNINKNHPNLLVGRRLYRWNESVIQGYARPRY